MAAELSCIRTVQLIQLVLVVSQQQVLLFLRQTLLVLILTETLLALLNPTSQGELLVLSFLLLLLLTTHHVIVVIIFSFQLRLYLIVDCLLLQFNCTDTAFLLLMLQLLEPLQCFPFILEFNVVLVRLANELQA